MLDRAPLCSPVLVEEAVTDQHDQDLRGNGNTFGHTDQNGGEDTHRIASDWTYERIIVTAGVREQKKGHIHVGILALS